MQRRGGVGSGASSGGRFGVLVALLGGVLSAPVALAQDQAHVTLQARVFMAAFGRFEPLATRAPDEPPTKGSYLQFALDPGIPAGVLLDIEVPASKVERQLRVSIREGRAHPKVRWVSIPPARAFDAPQRVHVPFWIETLSFCEDVQIEVSGAAQKAPLLRRVVSFECGE